MIKKLNKILKKWKQRRLVESSWWPLELNHGTSIDKRVSDRVKGSVSTSK
jgi:hypothetical protein